MAGSASDSECEMWNRVPLVVILGPTGVGKSKLSLELAKRFSGEIISADSMQVYKGLDVITNKVTPEEQSIAPHHLLNFLDPLKNYTVVHFRNKALPIIKDIQTAGKLPIVVGGTHYYIESLLWQVLVDDENAEVADTKFDAVTAQALLQELESWAEFLRNLTRDRFVSLSDKTRQAAADVFSSIEDYAKDGVAHCLHSNASEVAIACEHLATSVPNVKARIRELLEAARPDLGDFRVDFEMRRVQDEINRKLHDRLRGIDPKTAAALHPNSRRKILRALQIHASKGQPQSDILGAQRSQDGGSSLGGPLRFKNTVMLWLRCEKDILDKRLDDRVDDMMNRGLVQELLDFHNKYNEDRLKNMDRKVEYDLKMPRRKKPKGTAVSKANKRPRAEPESVPGGETSSGARKKTRRARAPKTRGRKKAKGKGKSKGKSRSRVKKRKEPPTVAAPPATESATNLPRTKATTVLTKEDSFVMTILWSLEAVHAILEAWKSSFLLYGATPTPKPTRGISHSLPKFTGRIIQIVLTLLTTAAVSFAADGRPKLHLLVGGLLVYSLVPLFGLLINHSTVAGFTEVLLMAQIGWISVNPIRYFLIFGQKYPLTVIQTRSLITYNEMFVDFTEYFTAILVTLRTFNPLVYDIAWSIVLVMMIIWVGSIVFARNWVTKTDDRIEVAMKIYEENDKLESFLARQTTRHLIIFMCILFPSMMMAMHSSTVSFVFKLLRNDLSIFVQYRFDLIIALSFLPIITGLLITVFDVRQEMRDLFVIGIALFLNILISAVFIWQILNVVGSEPIETIDSDERTSNVSESFRDLDIYKLPPNTVFVYIFYPNSFYDGMAVKIPDTDSYYIKKIKRGFRVYAKKGTTVTCECEFPNQTTIIVARDLKINDFAGYVLDYGSLVEIQNFGQLVVPQPDPVRPFFQFASDMKPCDSGPQWEGYVSRILINGGCASLRVNFSMQSAENENVTVPIRLPFLGGELSDPVPFLEGAEYMAVEYLIDGKHHERQNGILPKESGERFSRAIFFCYVETSVNPASILSLVYYFDRFTYKKERWPNSDQALVVTGLSVASVVTGIASASYIHFIWIQCPFKHRMLILGAFVALNYIGAVIPILLLTKDGPKPEHFIILLCLQVFGGIWHVMAAFFFGRQLRTLNTEEKKNIRGMKF